MKIPETLKCPYLLAGRESSQCAAGNVSYVPSTFQVQEYCRVQYVKCPFYLGNISKGKGIRSCVMLRKVKAV